MTKLPYSLLAFFLLFGLTLQAKDSSGKPPYFDAATVDYKSFLPNPPAVGSPETLKELDLIRADQAARTPEEIKRIKREADHLNVFLYDTVLGPWFKEDHLPLTKALFRHVERTINPVVVASKDFWNRPRPFVQDPRIHPPIDLPHNPAYPSGHSTAGYLDALVLAQLAPDLKDAILARGRQIGDDRVIAGVHFPSDVAAGRTLAEHLLTDLQASPEFQADFAAAKAEIAAERAKP